VKIEFNHLTGLGSVVREPSSGSIYAALLVGSSIAEGMKESVNTGTAQRRQSRIDLIHLRHLIGDVKIELFVGLVALISVVPQASSVLRQLRSVRDRDELVVGLDPVSVGKAALVSSNRLRSKSFGE
jgi:hypothetical protein